VRLALSPTQATADSFLGQLALLWTIAIVNAMHSSRSHDAAIRVYDGCGNVIETQEHKGDFKE
jgi:hypothetical protein